MPPQRRMVKKRADVQGKGAFKDSQGLLNGCCWFSSPNCCYISLDSGDKLSESLKAMEQCMESQRYLCVLWLFGLMGFILHTPLALPLCRPNAWSSAVLSPLSPLSPPLSNSCNIVGTCWGAGDRLCGWEERRVRRSETGLPVGQSRAITGQVAPQPLPGGKPLGVLKTQRREPLPFTGFIRLPLVKGI